MKALNLTWITEDIKYILLNYIDEENSKEARKSLIKVISRYLKEVLKEE